MPGEPSDRNRDWARLREPAPRINVGGAERVVSAVGGGALVLYGASRGTLGGLGLALLGGALAYRGVSGHCAAYEALGVDTARGDGPGASVSAGRGVKIEESVIVTRSRDELYRYWRDLANLPRIMSHLRSVEPLGDGRSRWVAEGPLGATVEWDAEIITERENELIGWRTVGDSTIDAAGSVHFTPAADGRATVVRVSLRYDPPAGRLGSAVVRMLGQSPARWVRDDLQRFKRTMESDARRFEALSRGVLA